MKTIVSTFILALFLFSYSNAQQIKPITSTEVAGIVKTNKKAVVLDVRTLGEYSSGHIAKSVNIDVNQPDATSKYLALDKSKTYIVICRTKNRSGVVANYMIQNGFANIYQVMDGMVGWTQNNLPIEK